MKRFVKILGALAVLVAAVWSYALFVEEPFHIPSRSMQPSLLPGDFVWVDKRFPVQDLQRGDIVIFRHEDDDDENIYIKRVIGLPGDTFKIEGNLFVLNGKPFEQKPIQIFKRDPQQKCQAQLVDNTVPQELGLPPFPFFKSYKKRDALVEVLPNGKAFYIQKNKVERFIPKGKREEWQSKETTIPAGQYFVMGDNRSSSVDSRDHGFVSAGKILGKATGIWFSISYKRYSCGSQPLDWAGIYFRNGRSGRKL